MTGLEAINRTLPDLVFLDIEMKGIHGLDLARKMPAGVMLIFTTAYAQFALDGFELNAIDFLHKPYSFGRFETAVKKAIHLRSLQMRAQQSDEQSLVVKADYKNIKNSLLGNYLSGSHQQLCKDTPERQSSDTDPMHAEKPHRKPSRATVSAGTQIVCGEQSVYRQLFTHRSSPAPGKNPSRGQNLCRCLAAIISGPDGISFCNKTRQYKEPPPDCFR